MSLGLEKIKASSGSDATSAIEMQDRWNGNVDKIENAFSQSGAAGGTIKYDLTDQMDGVTQVFNIDESITENHLVLMEYGGQVQNEGTNFTVNCTNHTLTTLFPEPPDATDNRKLTILVCNTGQYSSGTGGDVTVIDHLMSSSATDSLSAKQGLVLNRKIMVGDGAVYTTTGDANNFIIDLENIVSNVTTGMIIKVKFHVEPAAEAKLTITNPTVVATSIHVRSGRTSPYIAEYEINTGYVYNLCKSSNLGQPWIIMYIDRPVDDLSAFSISSFSKYQSLSADEGKRLGNKRKLEDGAALTSLNTAVDSQFLGYIVNLSANATFGSNLLQADSFIVGSELIFLIVAVSANRTVTIPNDGTCLVENGVRSVEITSGRSVEISVLRVDSAKWRFVISGEFY